MSRMILNSRRLRAPKKHEQRKLVDREPKQGSPAKVHEKIGTPIEITEEIHYDTVARVVHYTLSQLIDMTHAELNKLIDSGEYDVQKTLNKKDKATALLGLLL